ncbi:MAG: sensor histidine kinase [Ignavibacteria bacterium]
MISLIPSWARNYSEFWDTLKERNLWLIKLRYGASGMLIIFLLSAEILLKIKLTYEQILAITIITLSIFFYNILLHYIRRFVKPDAGKFNPLHLSLLQMILDFSSLLMLVYFTGGIESPLYMLFIFHMIIGSLILPGPVIYSVAVSIIAAFSAMVFSEYYRVIHHHHVEGLLNFSLYDNLNYCITFLTIFAFVMLISVLLANKIVKQLYRMEQDLLAALDKLNAAEIEKQKYIIGIVHELKTPLAAVQSYLNLILQKFLGPLNEKVEERLYRASQRSEEAIKMINDVLRISKLRLLDEIAFEEVEISEIICSVFEKQKINADMKKINFELKKNTPGMRKISGDRFLLELAFSNITGNAIKYTGSGGKVKIILDDSYKENIIKICDSGVGIPKEEIDKIFTDFYRASNIKKLGLEGAGLGLSFVKQIIEKHGGRISVQSPSEIGTAENPGACFTVNFPVLK